jgi:hypothetical protein
MPDIFLNVVRHLSWECMTFGLSYQDICPKGVGHFLRVQDICPGGAKHGLLGCETFGLMFKTFVLEA